ncbi:MAG TPA: hypothetical protein DEF00_03475 [Candidatus Taylorbacteria bacterium]|nr:MAG: hypothetical protein UY29_C0005G0021 [Parcubacteria group bacterium GW2011_GWC2_48_17]HBV01424.1 hypothetical protein [Candidatus Taylorbacteria bacterium]
MSKFFSKANHKGFTQMNSSSKNSRGFTLIELLVVIAIIGILSSVVLASLNSARTKARDTRRVADLKQIQIAMELYYDANGSYPVALSSLVGSGSGASLPVLPTDPKDQSAYKFSWDPLASPTKYHLGATMEQTMTQTTLDTADSDANSTAWGGGTKFSGADTADPWTYDVNN